MSSPTNAEPIVEHPERVEADVIVRVVPVNMPGGSADIEPVGAAPVTMQKVPPDILQQIEGRYGYFRARWDGGPEWSIGKLLPKAEWPEEGKK